MFIRGRGDRASTEPGNQKEISHATDAFSSPRRWGPGAGPAAIMRNNLSLVTFAGEEPHDEEQLRRCPSAGMNNGYGDGHAKFHRMQTADGSSSMIPHRGDGPFPGQ